jgi:O-antigen ligase
VLLATLVGWYRFISGAGGDEVEHALGYWGIRYTSATRNSDVLYPLVGGAAMLCKIVFERSRSLVLKSVDASLLFIFCTAVMFSFSRGAWVAYIMLIVAVLYRSNIRASSIALAFAATSVTLVLMIYAIEFASQYFGVDFGANLFARFSSIIDPSADTTSSNDIRVDLFFGVLSGVAQHPLGAGAGNSAFFLYDTDVPLANAENAILTAIAEGGLIAAFALAVVLAIGMLGLVRDTKDSVGVQQIGGGVGLVLFGYLLFNHELNSLFVWLLISFALATSVISRDKNPSVTYRSAQ